MLCTKLKKERRSSPSARTIAGNLPAVHENTTNRTTGMSTGLKGTSLNTRHNRPKNKSKSINKIYPSSFGNTIRRKKKKNVARPIIKLGRVVLSDSENVIPDDLPDPASKARDPVHEATRVMLVENLNKPSQRTRLNDDQNKYLLHLFE